MTSIKGSEWHGLVLLLSMMLLFSSSMFFTLDSTSLNNWIHFQNVKGQSNKSGNEWCLCRAWHASLSEQWGSISVWPPALPPTSRSSLLHRLWLNILKYGLSAYEYQADGITNILWVYWFKGFIQWKTHLTNVLLFLKNVFLYSFS